MDESHETFENPFIGQKRDVIIVTLFIWEVKQAHFSPIKYNNPNLKIRDFYFLFCTKWNLFAGKKRHYYYCKHYCNVKRIMKYISILFKKSNNYITVMRISSERTQFNVFRVKWSHFGRPFTSALEIRWPLWMLMSGVFSPPRGFIL